MTRGGGEDPDFEKLAGVSRAKSAPRLLQVVGRAAGLRIVGEEDLGRRCAVQSSLRPLNTRYPMLAAVPLRYEGVQGFGAANESLPGLWIGVAKPVCVNRREPSIKPIVPDAEGHVADAGQEFLVEPDARVLHAKRIEPVFLPVLGPFGI